MALSGDVGWGRLVGGLWDEAKDGIAIKVHAESQRTSASHLSVCHRRDQPTKSAQHHDF